MRLLLSVLLLTLVFAAPSLVAQTARQDRVDDASIQQAARTLTESIRSAVTQAGGDPERQHVHLVFAFSTGHFNKDPLGAQAAREIAWLVVKDLLVPGDRVSVFAWEMSLWDHLQGKPNSLILSGSDEQSKLPVKDLFPYTVQDGSLGGHDTERAIVEITQRLGDVRDAVIVLLTNDAQSVAPEGQQTIGADNPEYQATLQQWTRLPQVNESGASLVLPFKVIRVDDSISDRKLDVVTLLSQPFSGASIEGGTRSDKLRRPAPSPPPAPQRPTRWDWLRRSWLWLLLAAALVAATAFGVWKARGLVAARAPSVVKLKIGKTEVDISKAAEGETLCLLVGEEYKPLGGDDTPTVQVARGTNVVLAELVLQKKNNEIKLQCQEAVLDRIDGQWVDLTKTSHSLKIGQEHHLQFTIEQPSSGPRKVQEVDVQIEPIFGEPKQSDQKGG